MATLNVAWNNAAWFKSGYLDENTANYENLKGIGTQAIIVIGDATLLLTVDLFLNVPSMTNFIEVYIDGTVITRPTAAGTGDQQVSIAIGTLSAGNHTLKIQTLAGNVYFRKTVNCLVVTGTAGPTVQYPDATVAPNVALPAMAGEVTLLNPATTFNNTGRTEGGPVASTDSSYNSKILKEPYNSYVTRDNTKC